MAFSSTINAGQDAPPTGLGARSYKKRLMSNPNLVLLYKVELMSEVFFSY